MSNNVQAHFSLSILMHQLIEERFICCFTNKEQFLANAFTVNQVLFAQDNILRG